MWKYDDYLAVSEDFIPVFSEEVDKNHKGNWKFFIPHDHMKNLMEKLILSLERTHVGDKRSLWLTGAYGTGKTFASFVIKHLLEDDLDEIRDYFQKHQILAPLWPRFKALRENNRYLVVYRSASGHIMSTRRLMIEIQQAIKEQLNAQGYTKIFSESIIDQLVDKLSDRNGIFNWEGILNKYRDRYRTLRELTTVDEVIKRLNNGDVKLAEDVASALEDEGLALVDSPVAVKAWIKDVITANSLQGIIFIWDEFTEYFVYNASVTPLQELAHATADMPFYLFLVTHRALNQFTRIDDDTRRKLLDRFHNCQLEMRPVTAYKLISNVIEAKADFQDEWEAKRDSLWSKVDVAVLHINLLGERVNKDELKMLAPIHPFTAYLLATISSLYSSSQRTLFQFLKTNEPGSFQWFVANYPKDDWYWLTPDYLWQYFFEDAKIETIESVSDILSHFHSVKDRLTNLEEMRVFRVMLLLTALWRQTQGAHSSLLKPSLSVIKRMFVGTDLYNKVDEVAEGLCARGIMLAVPSGSDCEYIIPTTTIDQTKMQHYKERAENSLTFEKMINVEKTDAEFSDDLKELLYLQGAAKLRHPVQIISAREMKLRRERVVRGVESSYEVGVIFVVAQEDEHLNDSEEIAIEISKAYTNYCILISQIAFGIKRWREWLDYRARSWYHEEMRDGSTKRYYDTKSKNIVNEWLGAVRTGRIRAFFRGKQEELSGCEHITDYLEDIIETVYPYGPEKLSKIATLYTNPWGKAGAEVGLGVAQNIQRPYKDVVEILRNQGIWEDEELAKQNNHLLNKMKNVVDNFFASQDHVNLKQLWEALQQPPYGLMPSPIGILLFAFLLRDYAQGYYYSDNVNSFPLNPNKLAELIEQVMKGAKQSENYTIRKMSTQGELFCQMARQIFHLTVEQTAYPEEARKYMRDMVKGMGYPLWTLVYYVQKASSTNVVEEMAQATKTLGDILSYGRDELSDQEMKAVVEAVHPVRRELSTLLSRDRMQEGMKIFWSVHAPQLISLMASLNLDVSQVMTWLRALFEEDVYLWREERVREKLPEIVSNLDLTDALNNLCGVDKQNLDDLRNYFRNNWFKSKLPLLYYKEEQPAEIADLVDYLNDLIYSPGHGVKSNRANDIRRYRDRLISLLSGGVTLTGILVKKYTGQRLSDHEAGELYDALPNLSGATEDEVRRAIIEALSQQTRQKKLSELRQYWMTLTGFESPEQWSEEMRTPIQWVLEGQSYHSFFNQFNNLYRLSKKEIDEMMAFLNNHADDLAILKDRQYVLDRFVQVVAGDYAGLVRQADVAAKLRDYIYRVLNGKVHQWPMRLNEINQLVRRWITENYRDTVYPQIRKIIEAMSPDETKRFIMRLIVEDALVGVRLLAIIQEEK